MPISDMVQFICNDVKTGRDPDKGCVNNTDVPVYVAGRADPILTPWYEVSELGLHCLLKPI